jgi:hypothetical protein
MRFVIEEIERLARKIKFTPCNDANKRILSLAESALDNSIKTKPAVSQPVIWRIIMKSNITKFAAAALVIITIILSFNIWDKFVPAAYALEQTIKANHSIRSIYFKCFTVNQDEPKEYWVVFDDNGQVKNLRGITPEWSSPEDGAKVVIWKDNKAQVWFKKKKSLLTVTDKTVVTQLLRFVEGNDPRTIVDDLKKQQIQGKVQLKIVEPSQKSESIIITATFAHGEISPDSKRVYFVDQVTKLVTRMDNYELKDNEYQYIGRIEYYNYNKPIDPKMFVLDEVPADVMRVDQTTQDVGLVQGSLTNEEIAVEVIKQFFNALIAEDYAKAGKLLEGTPAENMKQMFGKYKFLRIISIGQAGPHPNPDTRGLVVPCTVEIEKDGQKGELKLERLSVRQVYNQPGRWTIFGGI